MKISSSFWRFPGSEWESATLSPNFHFFFICNFIFFHFPLFLMVFHCFSWLSWISGATGKENEKKMIKKWKKWKKKMKISSSFWRFPGSEWESATLSPSFHFFFICNFIFFSFSFVFWWFSIVFHCFSWLSWISGATGKENEKKNDKKMKKKWKFPRFWRFPGSEWESATLSPNFHFFFHLRLHFFSFSFVFDGFPLFFIVFHGFPGFQVPRARKMKKKWKNNEKNEKKKKENFLEFLKISWFGVRICNFESKFSFFFICDFIFFHFPLFLMVFHCFSLFFMAFLDFRCHGQGKWKKNDKKNEKKMKISSSFWRFPGSEWESATLSPNFHFFSFATSFFFHFPLFLMVFHCFSLFFMAFLDFRCHGQGKWKNNEKNEKKKKKKSSSFWRFPGSEWESATLSPNFHFFFPLQTSFFFSLSFVFHCFSWLSWISGATGKENEKKMKISSSFWRFPGSEWESATLSPNFHFFFICNFIFFSFSFVFDGFPLFFIVFHGFPGFQVPRERKMKKKW